MSLRIRRGTNAQRTGVTLDLGEIAYTTDTKKLYVGDGITSGGINIIQECVGTGLEWDNTTQTIRYTGALGDALQNLVEDTSPQLGGNLDLNNRVINGSGTINFTGNITATGTLTASTGLGANLSLNGNAIVGTGDVNITGDLVSTGTLTATTGLGANLSLNGNDITGTGNIDITGNITAAGYLNVYNSKSSVEFSTQGGENINLGAITTGTGVDFASIGMNVSKGTVSVPTAVLPGEFLGGYAIRGYHSSGWKPAVNMVANWDASAVLTSDYPSTVFNILIGDNSSGGIPKLFTMDYTGTFTTETVSVGDGDATNPSIVFNTDGGVDTGFFHPGDGIVCISTNAVERVRVDTGGMRVDGFMKVKDFGSDPLPSPPEAGMIVLQGGTFQGYTGSAWVTLG